MMNTTQNTKENRKPTTFSIPKDELLTPYEQLVTLKRDKAISDLVRQTLGLQNKERKNV